MSAAATMREIGALTGTGGRLKVVSTHRLAHQNPSGRRATKKIPVVANPMAAFLALIVKSLASFVYPVLAFSKQQSYG